MKKLRGFIVILLAMLVMPSFVGAERASYIDVHQGHSHYDAIIEMTEKGMLTGYQNADETRSFRPNEYVSRVHAAVILANVSRLAIPKDVPAVLENLSDVNVSNPYAEQIAANYVAGYFRGSNGRFLVDAHLTREQMASVLVNVFDLKLTGTVQINLSNVSPSHRGNVQALADHGLTNQLRNYRPTEFITRGQFASFLNRALEQTANQAQKHVGEQVFELVNKERASRGLSRLRFDNAISYAADQIAADIVKNNYFEHESPVYGTLAEKLDYFDIHYYSAGENLAKGHRNPQEVMKGWMDSSGHRVNILEASYTHLGVGYDERQNVWVQLFVGR